jgi:hypothetical protein
VSNPIALEIVAKFRALREFAATADSNVAICMEIERLEREVAYYFGEVAEPKEIVIRPETRWG